MGRQVIGADDQFKGRRLVLDHGGTRVSRLMALRRVGVAATLCLALAGCGSGQAITETAFEREASDGASIMSAAAQTLRFVHAEPAGMTVEYGAGSMINYLDQASSLPDELPTADGAPDIGIVDQLVLVVRPAIAVIENPCLVSDCDYSSQIQTLDAARDALLLSIQ